MNTRILLANKKYHRKIVSARTAVHVLEKIQDVLTPETGNGWCCWGEPNNALYSMLDEIKRLKRDSEKYHQLRKLLKETIS